MEEEIIFHGTLVQYWGVIFSIWEMSMNSEIFVTEPFQIPKTYRSDTLPDNLARLKIWWEESGVEVGSVIAIARPASTSKLIVNINEDAKDAQQKWFEVKDKLETDGWASDKSPSYLRPPGYEIQADNTGGTAIYKRDQLGDISETKLAPNPGWGFEVSQKSIAIKPENIELNHTLGNFQPGLYPSSAKDTLFNLASETLSGLTKDQDIRMPPVGVSKPVKPSRKALLDQACIEWVNRGNRGYLGRYTRDDFLEDFQEKTGVMITKDEFRRALEDAKRRGIILKVNGRLRPKTGP